MILLNLGRFFLLLIALIFIVLAASSVSADLSQLELSFAEVKSTSYDFWKNTAFVVPGDKVHVRAGLFIVPNYYGEKEPFPWVTTQTFLEIYGLNNNGSWTLINQTPVRTNYQYINESKRLYWYDLITVDERYAEYMVIVNGKINRDKSYKKKNAFLIFNTLLYPSPACSEVSVNIGSVDLMENNAMTGILTVTNNSLESFVIESITVSNTSNLAGFYFSDFDNLLKVNETRTINFLVKANSVLQDSFSQANIKVTGTFANGKHCSDNIQKSFNLTVRDAGGNDGNDGEQGPGFGVPGVPEVPEDNLSSCDKVNLHSQDVQLNEGTEKFVDFYLENLSSKDFYVKSMSSWTSSEKLRLELINYDFIVKANSSEKVTVKVTSYLGEKGLNLGFIKFNGSMDGETCKDKTFNFNIIVGELESPPEEEPPVKEQPSCSNVFILDNTITIEKGMNNYPLVVIQNNSEQDFFVESVSVFDQDSRINSSVYDYDSILRANTSSELNLHVFADNSTDYSDAFIIVQARGNFTDGTECSFNDVGSKAVKVNFNETLQPKTPIDCSNLKVNFPNNVVLKTLNDRVRVNVFNPLDVDAKVSLTSNKYSLNQNIIYVPAQSNVDTDIIVTPVTDNPGEIFVDVKAGTCKFNTRFAGVRSALPGLILFSSPPVTISGGSGDGVIQIAVKNESLNDETVKVFFENLPSNAFTSVNAIIPSGEIRVLRIPLNFNVITENTVGTLVIQGSNQKLKANINIVALGQEPFEPSEPTKPVKPAEPVETEDDEKTPNYLTGFITVLNNPGFIVLLFVFLIIVGIIAFEIKEHSPRPMPM
ncbi:MAG: hypothetical protein ABH821_05340 [archaeon]